MQKIFGGYPRSKLQHPESQEESRGHGVEHGGKHDCGNEQQLLQSQLVVKYITFMEFAQIQEVNIYIPDIIIEPLYTL
jgi:hypothetical protein